MFRQLTTGEASARAIVLARAVWKSGTLPKWSGVPLAIGLALYIPQLQGTPMIQPIRIADGLLIAIGAIWIAWGTSKRNDADSRPA